LQSTNVYVASWRELLTPVADPPLSQKSGHVMLNLILWSLVVVCLLGIIAFLVIRTKNRAKPELTIRNVICQAKATLLDKKNKPKIYRCCKIKKTENLIVSSEFKKSAVDRPGTFRFRWPHLDLKYILKDNTEEMRIQMTGQDKVATLFFIDGSLGGMSLGDERIHDEHFEMRQAGNIADQLRRLVRHHLKLEGGKSEIEKLDEPTFNPVLDVNALGEIKLKEIPATWNKANSKASEEHTN
jgi:hypothetical protein